MKKWKAVYTVEASVIVPLMIAAMALGMRLGIALYIEIRDQNEQEVQYDMWEVEDFYKFQILKEVANDKS